MPSKLSGITEKENSDSRDTQESLNKSYSKMKNKLDELEEYNQQLENQLNTIFSSISASAHRADRSGNIGRHQTLFRFLCKNRTNFATATTMG